MLKRNAPPEPDSGPVAEVSSYPESIEYRRYQNGYRIIMPSPLDVALKRMQLDDYRLRLERHDAEPVPPEIDRLEKGLDKLQGRQYEEAVRRLNQWADRRIDTRRYWQGLIFDTERDLASMEQMINDPDSAGGEPETETYVLRKFRHRERMQADDRNSEVDSESHQRIVNIAERNTDLLGRVLLGRKNGNGLEEVDPDDLDDTVALILEDRMMAYNRMPRELAPYFRDGG